MGFAPKVEVNQMTGMPLRNGKVEFPSVAEAINAKNELVDALVQDKLSQWDGDSVMPGQSCCIMIRPTLLELIQLLTTRPLSVTSRQRGSC